MCAFHTWNEVQMYLSLTVYSAEMEACGTIY